MFGLDTVTLAALAQGVRIDRPPAGTLRRGWFGLDSPRAPTVLLSVAIAVVVVVIVVAVVRRIRAR
ncbi:MAG: hypothetical protein JNK05_04730 [Myxococcales bacterium]|nr:hypothetical protein [Myxococcales bacterium]